MRKSLFSLVSLLLLFVVQVSANIKETRLYVNDFTVSPGEEFVLPVMFDGNVYITQAQLELTVPEGFDFDLQEIQVGRKTLTYYSETSEIAANLSPTENLSSDGRTLGIVFTDLTNTGTEEYEGEFAYIYMKVSETLAPGEYKFQLKGVVCADDNADTYEPADAEITVTVAKKYSVNVTSVDETMGTVAIDPVQDEYLGGSSATVTATAAEGYHFVKWSDEATDNPYTFTVEADTELTATFAPNQYTITFVLGNGEENVVLTQDYKSELTAPTPTRTGYTFAGWDEEVPATVPLGDKTFTAQWTLDEYTITYDLDGGAVATANPESYTIESDAITLVNPTKEGYTFAGWTGTDLTAATETVTIAKGSIGNRSYKATWTVNQYTITFDTDGGSEVAAITQDYGTAVTAPADPTKAGYTFAGWDKEIPATIPAEDVTITAQWTIITYTIEYDLAGGQWPATVAAVTTYDVESDNIEIPTPERTYYEFMGWTSEDVAEPVIPWIITKGSTGNLKLTANWQISTGINAVMVKGQKADVYTIDGRLVKRGMTTEEAQQLPRGLYIVNGKKVAVK